MMQTPIEIYRQNFGQQLFPLRRAQSIGDPNAKRPLVAKWQTRKYTSKELADYWEKGHAIGWALGPNDLVIDVDAPTPQRPDKKGLESLPKLENALGSQLAGETVEVFGPTGGRHYYLSLPEPMRVREVVKELPGIEFLSQGSYVVIAGSPHWQGGLYRFSDMTECFGFGRKKAPKALIDLLRKPEPIIDDEGPTVVSPNMLARMLEPLNITDYRDHDDWFRIFAAAHHATGGSREGLEVFLSWSTSDPNYESAKDDITHRWSTLNPAAAGGITIATLIDELIHLGHDEVVSMVRASLEFNAEPIAEDKKPKPRIVYENDETVVNAQIIDVLAEQPNVFQRNGALVEVSDTINELSAISLCKTISGALELGDFDKKQKWHSIRIPERVGRQIVAESSWFGVRRLRCVSRIPVLTSDGVLQTPGYDSISGVFLSRSIDVPKVKATPTKADALAALDLLNELVIDFPFAEGSHRSAWLAALFAAIARPAIDGPVPMTFVDGNQRGVGKGLLLHVLSLIVTGEDMETNSTMPAEDEEMQKVLVALARRNPIMTMFDNIKTGSKLGLASLDAALTTGAIAGRILGKSDHRKMQFDTMLFGTGNRITINEQSDIIRRLNYIHLKANIERPENRSEFRWGGDAELKSHVINNRGRYIHAALTILQAAHVADLSTVEIEAWGSYQSFSEIVRKALVWLDLPDPIESRKSIERLTESGGNLSIVIEGVEAVAGNERLTAAELYSRLQPADFQDEEDDRPESVAKALELLAPAGYKSPSLMLASRVRKDYRDQVHDGRWLRCEIDPHKKQMVYWVEAVC